ARGRAPGGGPARGRAAGRGGLARLLPRPDARRLLLRLADRHAHDVGGVPAVEIGDRLRELGFERRALLRRQRAGREAFLLTAAPVAPAAASPASPAPSAGAVGLAGALGCGRAPVPLLRVVRPLGRVPARRGLEAGAVLGRRVIAILLVAVAAFAAAAAAPPPPAAAAPLTGLAGRRAVGMRVFELAVVAGKLRRLGFIRLERFLFVGELLVLLRLALGRSGGRRRLRRQRLGLLDAVHLLALLDHERHLTADIGVGSDHDDDAEALLQGPQVGALVVEQVERDLGARAHGEIVGGALEQHLLERAQ